MATKKKALAKTTTKLPVKFNFEKDAGSGMEGADKDSFAIPFLAVIQKMSPQVDEGDPKFIANARPGMLMNTVTNELFDGKKGVIFLPCAYQRRFIHWGPRDQGGGFKGEVTPEEAVQLEMNGTVVNVDGRLYYPGEKGTVDEKKSDYLSDTRNHFGLLEDGTQMLLSVSSTQIKKSKQLMTLMNQIKIGDVTPPTWVNRVRITTLPESNDKGSWHGLKVELEGFIDSQQIYDAGKSLHDIIVKGGVKVNYETAQKVDEKF